MAQIRRTLLVEAPPAVVYERCIAFADYGNFLPGLRDSSGRGFTVGLAAAAGKPCSFELAEARPDELLVLVDTMDVQARLEITFAAINRTATWMTCELTVSVEGKPEPARFLDGVSREMTAALRAFREWVEEVFLNSALRGQSGAS